MTGEMRIYYDEEADYLEIFVGEPRQDYGEHISDDIVLFKYEDTEDLYGIGIFNFKKQSKHLQNALSKLPFRLKLQAIKEN